MTGQGAPAGGSGQGYRQPHQSYEDRQQAREQMMSTVRENSQQDRRVYVGNLSYDVKWHHLKDFMRQGGSSWDRQREDRGTMALTGLLCL